MGGEAAVPPREGLLAFVQQVEEPPRFHLIVAATIVAFAGGLYLQSIRYVLDSPEELSLAHPIRF